MARRLALLMMLLLGACAGNRTPAPAPAPPRFRLRLCTEPPVHLEGAPGDQQSRGGLKTTCSRATASEAGAMRACVWKRLTSAKRCATTPEGSAMVYQESGKRRSSIRN